jgi:hypothetical protein
MRVKLSRKRLRDTGDADILGDMPRQLAFRQPEIAENFRNEPAVMVAGEEIRRAPPRIIFQHRRNISGSEE